MKIPALMLGAAVACAATACSSSDSDKSVSADSQSADSVYSDSVPADTASAETPEDSVDTQNEATRYSELTERDFKKVADELGVEVAAMKAVVEIETGNQMKGFLAPGVPVINFDPVMYRQIANKAPDKSGVSGEEVPDGLTGHGLAEYTQLIKARQKNAQGALMGTFWGMFQIGGFHYKRCGYENVNDFIKAMSDSELSQLEIFANFIKGTDMLQDLRNKDWASFSRKYNGPAYAKRKYHTRMADAYNRYNNS